MKPFVAVDIHAGKPPADWNTIRLCRAARLIEEEDLTSTCQMLSLSSNGRLTKRDAHSKQAPSQEYRAKFHRVLSGDLVVNPMWISGGGIGVSEVPGAVSPEYRVYRFKPEYAYPRFVHYLMRSVPYLDQYALLIRADTTFDRRVTKEDFRQLPLMLPPLESQYAIADFLDREAARIDALIEKKRRMLELLSERFINTIAEVAGSRRRLKTILAERDERDRIQEEVLSVYRDRGVLPKSSREDNFNKTPEDLSRYKLVMPGDVVVNKMKAWQGSVAVSSYRGIVSGDYLVCKVTGDVNPSFLHYLLRSPRLIGEYAIRSTGIRPSQWRLYWEDFSSIEVTLPNRGEQDHLITELGGMVTLETLDRSMDRQATLLKERLQALITAAVTGQLDISCFAA